jgi:hypothetical protein
MKNIARILFLAFSLCFSAQLITAQTSKASGKFQISLDDGYTKYAEFDAATQADGSTLGSLFLSDEAPLEDQDVDGTNDPTNKYPGFYIKADLDGLTVDKNRAVMSGTIRDSSIKDFIGQRVLLTVEDNGDNTRIPDNLTWGLYKPVEKGETPTDAERKVDEGAGTRWTTSDAERKDDPEVVYPKDPTITTQSFDIQTYDFITVTKSAGDIVVQ